MKVFLSLLLFILTAQITLAQEMPSSHKNVIMMDAGGPFVVGIGAGYERYLSQNKKLKPTIRAGAGLVHSFQKISYYAGGSLLWGGTSNVELGVNYLVNYDQSTFSSLDVSQSMFVNGYQVIIGYRYQAKRGFLTRIYWVVPIGCCGSWFPIYSGLSLGYAF